MASYASPPSVGSSPSAGSRGRDSWTGSSGSSSGGGLPVKRYPHIKDILASAQPEVDRISPLNFQLERAKGYVSAATRAIEFKRPDLAYKEYIRGAEVAINLIPYHKDYGFFCDSRKGWEQEYRGLLKQVRNLEPMMEEIRRMIEDDNARSGVQPNIPVDGTGRPSSSSGLAAGSQRRSINGLQMPIVPSTAPNGSIPNGHQQTDGHNSVPRQMPQEIPRNGNLDAANDLSARFARLRTPSAGKVTGSISIPVPEDYLSARSSPSYNVSSSGSRSSMNGLAKPSGPRDMPSSHGPLIPPKVPVAMPLPAFPRAPDPTYSPSSISASSVAPPRRSIDGSRHAYYNHPNPPGVSHQLQRTKEENPYRPRTPNGTHSSIVSKSSSSDIPHGTAIKAETLMEYIKRYNVLLIDIRPRDQFDGGHIFTKSIMCIEPISLKEGVSAEDLEDRLVVSPESEQELFSRRNEFDVVVYYDQNTTSTSFLIGPPTSNKTPALRALYDTLYEFNDYKPLRDGRPPALLSGGLDAWIDLMGPNSLTMSKTAALMGSIQSRKLLPGRGSRPLGRQRMISANSSLEVRRRRLRDHKPLDLEEERAWSQKAQAEEVESQEYPHSGSDGEVEDTTLADEGPASPSFVSDYESFLRKFPALQQEPQSMVVSARLPQNAAVQFDRAPAAAVPSRPPPAVPRVSYSGLHDKQQSQPPLARQTSATRPALHPSLSTSRRSRLPRTGLVNFGVTCYMNSTIQCLSATVPLSYFFLEDRYKQYLQKNWKGSSGIMPGLYTNLIRSLWKSDVEAIKPTTFRTFCGRMNREWAIDRQQDAKEFYDFLVDCLHEDLNIHWNRTVLKPLTPAEEVQRERTPISVASGYEWQRFQHRDYSFVSSLFAGQHASRLRCTTCSNTSTTYEAFYSISVEIPHNPGPGADIHSCLRSYTQEEMLSGDEVWKCPYCKCEREATKQIILTRMPQFLVIHFKRFSASKTETARKIHTPIEFPLHNLSMDPFVIQHPPPSQNPHDGHKEPAPVEPPTTPPYSYDCYGVLRHLGNTLTSGHYISLVKDQGRGCWRKYDDERTVDFDPARLQGRERLQNGEAYILFYQRAAPR